MQAKEDAARSPATDQDAFGNVKSSRLQLVLFAEGVVDKISQVGQVVNVERLTRHESADSWRMKGLGMGRTAEREELAVWGSCSSVKYRQATQTDLSRKAGKMKKPVGQDAGYSGRC
jgi:hypothetical protein